MTHSHNPLPDSLFVGKLAGRGGLGAVLFGRDVMLEHGGRLRQAAARFGIPLQEWLDLSTGVNPTTWPVPTIPAAVWNRLPETQDGLEIMASRYYGCRAALPLAGSQAAIQQLPGLRPPGRVGIVAPTYAEHPHAWQNTGHDCRLLAPEEVEAALPTLEVLLVVNPNNPTGWRFPRARLLEWHQRLQARGGWLVVDEAFMDVTPEESVADSSHQTGLIVLRSLGKFFGLAGARCGFLLAEADLLRQMESRLGPWCVPNPTRWVAVQSLGDVEWHKTMRQQLQRDGARLGELWQRHGMTPAGATALFQWIPLTNARAVQEQLAQQGIWLRGFDTPSGLRCGLPATPEGWERLQRALATLTCGCGKARSPAAL